MCPLKVYLDSCDFSDLSDPAKDSREIREIFSRLHQWSVSGEVVFIYSYVHIAEVTPTTVDAIFHARRRGEMIATLCRGNCFKFPQKILRNELNQLSGVYDQEFSEVTRNNGWLPEEISIFSRDAFRSAVENEVKDILNSSGGDLTRNQRRVAKKKSRKLKSYEFSSKKFLEDRFSEIKNVYPVRSEFKDKFFGYLNGAVSDNAMNEAIYQEVADPQWVCEWMLGENQYSEFVKTLRDRANRLFKLLDPAAREFRDHVIDHRRRGVISKAEFRESSNRMMVSEDSGVLEILNKIMEKEGIFAGVDSLGAAKQHAPGLYTALKTISSRFRKASLGEQRLLRSDFMDALHAIHAPYVDVFRADSDAAKNIPVLAGTQIVANIHGLIDAIEKRLSDQPANSSGGVFV